MDSIESKTTIKSIFSRLETHNPESLSCMIGRRAQQISSKQLIQQKRSTLTHKNVKSINLNWSQHCETNGIAVEQTF